MDIENQANRLINECHDISKGFMDKAEAELQYGFTLYQGGVVPGNKLRVVDIAGVDTEACCGTHADNSAEVGWIRLLRSSRISDGIVRLEYVAQERAIEVLNKETGILNSLIEEWGVDQSQIQSTASRFFNEYKRLSTEVKVKDQTILNLQVRYALSLPAGSTVFVRSDQDNPTLFVSQLPQFAADLQAKQIGVVFVNQGFVCGLLGKSDMLPFPELVAVCKQLSTKEPKVVDKANVTFKFPDKKKKPLNVKGVKQFMITGANYNVDKLAEDLTSWGAKEMEN